LLISLAGCGNQRHAARRIRPLSHDHPAVTIVTTIVAAAMPLIQSPDRSESGS
jgi:hypothetical protein